MQQQLSLVSLGYLCLCTAIPLTIILKRVLGSPEKTYHKLLCSFSLQYLLSSTLDSYTNTVFFLRGCLPSKMASRTGDKVYHMQCFIVSIKHLAGRIITLSYSG